MCLLSNDVLSLYIYTSLVRAYETTPTHVLHTYFNLQPSYINIREREREREGGREGGRERECVCVCVCVFTVCESGAVPL